ncbi:hypothetical protein CEE58_16065 [Stenotrophomonas maltophilia]|nr:hypothetical protein CEE58_16065 [Stenotrophomonas maltophilia]
MGCCALRSLYQQLTIIELIADPAAWFACAGIYTEERLKSAAFPVRIPIEASLQYHCWIPLVRECFDCSTAVVLIAARK